MLYDTKKRAKKYGSIPRDRHATVDLYMVSRKIHLSTKLAEKQNRVRYKQ